MMISVLRSPAVLASAAFAAMALLAFVVFTIRPTTREAKLVSSPQIGPETATLTLIESPPLDAETEATILERPLFEPSRRRRPPPPPAADPPVAEVTAPLRRLDGYRVVGLVVAAEASIALIERPGGGEALRIARGDVVEGWMADAVSERGIEFVQRGERMTLVIPKHDEGQRQSANAEGVP